jgi:hypothetical protein
MDPVPSELDGAKVIATAVVEKSVRPTGGTIHRGPDGVIPPASALAIVSGETGFYLFYCDHRWQVLADTWHSSVDNARAQAEFEYAGISKLWKDAVPVTPSSAAPRD